MDPRFNILLTQESKDVAIEHITTVWARLQNLKGTNGERARDDVEISDSSDNEQVEEAVDIIEQLLQSKDKEKQRAHGPEDGALENLLKSVKQFQLIPRLGRKENLFEFWERQKYTMPQLYEVACTVLSVPCTQVYMRNLKCKTFITYREMNN